MNKKYEILKKENILDIKIYENDLDNFLSSEEFLDLIKNVQEEIANILINYDEVNLILNSYNTYLLLSIVDEFNKNNINLLLKLNVDKEEITEELLNTLENLSIELLIDVEKDINKFKEVIENLLSKEIEKLINEKNTDLIIHPIYEILLNNLMKALSKDKNIFNTPETLNKFYEKEKRNYILSLKIEKDILEKIFPEYFVNEVIIK